MIKESHAFTDADVKVENHDPSHPLRPESYVLSASYRYWTSQPYPWTWNMLYPCSKNSALVFAEYDWIRIKNRPTAILHHFLIINVIVTVLFQLIVVLIQWNNNHCSNYWSDSNASRSFQIFIWSFNFHGSYAFSALLRDTFIPAQSPDYNILYFMITASDFCVQKSVIVMNSTTENFLASVGSHCSLLIFRIWNRTHLWQRRRWSSRLLRFHVDLRNGSFVKV